MEHGFRRRLTELRKLEKQVTLSVGHRKWIATLAMTIVALAPVCKGHAQAAPNPPTLTFVNGTPVSSSSTGVNQFTGLPMTSDGWTDLLAMYQDPNYYNDSRIIYVSSSQGNDSTAQTYSPGDTAVGSNPFQPAGAIKPFATISAGENQLRDGYPDILLLKRGDEFTSGTVGGRYSGRSQHEPMIFSSYGSGPRPILSKGGNEIQVITDPSNTAYRYLVFADFELYDAEKDPNSPRFLGPNQPLSGVKLVAPVEDVLLEDLYIRFGGIVADTGVRIQNLAVRRCVIVDNYSTNSHAQGIYANNVDNLLIEENVFDHDGWNDQVTGGGATIYNHNAYLQYTNTGVVFRGNISARASSHGVHQRSGGLNEDNLYLQNPLVQFGYSKGTSGNYGPFSGTFQNNVILDSRDIDSSNRRAIGLVLACLRNATITNNIVAHQRTGTGGARGINYDNAGTSCISADGVAITNNIVYDWTSSAGSMGTNFQSQTGLTYGNMTIKGNQLDQPSGTIISIPSSSIGAFSVSNNTFYGSNAFSPGSTFATWEATLSSTSDSFQDPQWADPARDLQSYMTSIGVPSTGYQDALSKFLSTARQQTKGNWLTAYTADAVDKYIRAGFVHK